MNVQASKFQILATDWARVREVVFVSAAESGTLTNVRYASLWCDRDNNGSYESRLSRIVPNYEAQVVDFVLATPQQQLLGKSRLGRFLVTMDMVSHPTNGKIGLEMAEVGLRSLAGKTVPASYVRYVGAGPTNHRVGQNAQLTVAMNTLATTDTVVENQKNVNLVRLTAQASRNDALLTSVTFVAAQGNLTDAYNYTVWTDFNGDGVVETIAQEGLTAQFGKVVANLGVGIAENATMVMELHADIANSISGNVLQVGLDTTSPSYIEAIDAESESPLVGIKTNGVGSGDITVTTAPSTVFTLEDAGNLFVTKSVAPVTGRYLLGGTEEWIESLDFTAEGEAVDVTAIFFPVATGHSVDSLVLRTEGGSVISIATVAAVGSESVPMTYNGQSVTTFCARMESGQLIIPEGQRVTVTMGVLLKTDVNGGVSGEPLQEVVMSGWSSVRARGVTSSNVLAVNNGDTTMDGEVFIGTNSAGPGSDILSSQCFVTMAEVARAENVDPNPDGTQIPTGAGRAISQTRLTAAMNASYKDGQNKVQLENLSFVVYASNVSLGSSSFFVYNKMNPSLTIACTVSMFDGTPVTSGSITGTFRVTCSGLSASAVDTLIGSGEDITIVLAADIQNTKIDNTQSSSLQVKTELGSSASTWFDEDNARRQLFAGHDLDDVLGTLYQG
jgi:hypothetical protein